MSEKTRISALTSEQKIMYAEIIKNFNNAYRKGSCVLCPEDSIRSHTISKSNYLKLIAEEGRVLQWSQQWWTENPDDFINLRPIHINDASTFPGFCAAHDGSVFDAIDAKPFQANRQQLFLQSFRAHVRELHCKQAQLEIIPEPAFFAEFHGLSNAENFTYADLALFQMDAMKAGLRDTVIHSNALESIRIAEDYTRMQHCVVIMEAKEAPFIACAGSFFPEILPNGTILQDFSDLTTPLQTLHFSLLPSDQGNYAIFSFLDVECLTPGELTRAVISHPKAADLICWMAFAYTENTFLRPSWWHALSDPMKNDIRNAFDHNASLSSPESHTVDSMPSTFTTDMIIKNIFWL